MFKTSAEMAGGLFKNWREAGNLILINTRRGNDLLKLNDLNTPLHELLGITVNRASLMPSALGLEEAPSFASNLTVLAKKRPSKVNSLNSAYSFPGGDVHEVDFDKDWLRQFGVKCDKTYIRAFGFTKIAPGTEDVPIYARQREDQYLGIPSKIAIRICAIRNTFVETGILVARSISNDGNQIEIAPTSDFQLKDDLKARWRKEVKGSPKKFLHLCQQQNIVPSVWSLYDWWNWLTPAGDLYKEDYRRDTMFFICCLANDPMCVRDPELSFQTKWVSPHRMLSEFSEAQVDMAPSLVYEMCRLLNFKDMDQLLAHLVAHSNYPVDRYMPYQIRCGDAYVFVFPGDSMYPEIPDFEGRRTPVHRTEIGWRELTKLSTRLNRLVMPLSAIAWDVGRFHLLCNIVPPYGNLPPRSHFRLMLVGPKRYGPGTH